MSNRRSLININCLSQIEQVFFYQMFLDIHILALGVALKDVKELRAVASSPADDNAINLKSFDELEVVKQRIFRDLAKSVCPRKLTCYKCIKYN